MMIDHEANLVNHASSETVDDEQEHSTSIQWKSLKKSLTNKEILSQAFLFLIAGSETTATTMTYVAYLLAKNPKIQTKLYEEIENALKEHVSQINNMDLKYA